MIDPWDLANPGEPLTGGQIRDREAHKIAVARLASHLADLEVSAGQIAGLSEDKRAQIRALRTEGRGVAEIAYAVGCSYTSAYKYSRGIRPANGKGNKT